jgi:hypothetical protein
MEKKKKKWLQLFLSMIVGTLIPEEGLSDGLEDRPTGFTDQGNTSVGGVYLVCKRACFTFCDKIYYINVYCEINFHILVY